MSERPVLRAIEDKIIFSLLILLVTFLFLEIPGRLLFKTGIPNSTAYVQHIVLWITFVGAMITTREGKHLALSVAGEFIKRNRGLQVVIAFVSITIITALFCSSVVFNILGVDSEKTIGIIPLMLLLAIIPMGFFMMLIRFLGGIEKGFRFVPVLGIPFGLLICLPMLVNSLINLLYFTGGEDMVFIEALENFFFSIQESFSAAGSFLFWPIFILLIGAAVIGTPLFIVLGGITMLLFYVEPSMIGEMPNQIYTVLTEDSIPAIPLFTLAGFILSESKAGERFVALFKASFGRLPGGMAVMTVIVCAFFTTFTGASGVTILALGGLLSFILKRKAYGKDFSEGLITSSGSVGLLFPPSLPIIMYGVAAQVDIRRLFIGGIIPGFLMVFTLAGMGIFYAVQHGIKPEKQEKRENGEPHPFLVSIWEILLPVIIIGSYFSGFATLVETGAIAVIYTILIEVFIYKDIRFRDLERICLKCVPIIGGILIILGISKCLSTYIVDAQIPTNLAAWMKGHIESPVVFLILLNLTLLATGCLMDIFSAILVVAPLVIELGKVYGIDPVHLGVIFLANLQIGYLTPPVGLNLFLASYRFNEPLAGIYKNVIPFFLALLFGVLLITYVPFLSTFLVGVVQF